MLKIIDKRMESRINAVSALKTDSLTVAVRLRPREVIQRALDESAGEKFVQTPRENLSFPASSLVRVQKPPLVPAFSAAWLGGHDARCEDSIAVPLSINCLP
jgi:cell division protein FtsX